MTYFAWKQVSCRECIISILLRGLEHTSVLKRHSSDPRHMGCKRYRPNQRALWIQRSLRDIGLQYRCGLIANSGRPQFFATRAITTLYQPIGSRDDGRTVTSSPSYPCSLDMFSAALAQRSVGQSS